MTTDPLAPARGVFLALAISMGFWVLFAIGIWWVATK